MADFRHLAIWMGCTLNCDPNWLSVFSPRIASIATRALNFGLYCFLAVVIDLLLCQRLRRNLSLFAGPKSGVHYRLMLYPTELRARTSFILGDWGGNQTRWRQDAPRAWPSQTPRRQIATEAVT